MPDFTLWPVETAYLNPLLIVGTALDGPVGEIQSFSLADSAKVALALRQYGEDVAESTVLATTDTTRTLQYVPWGQAYFASSGQTGYSLTQLPNFSSSGTTITFDSLPIVKPVSGFIFYKPIPSESANPGDTSLTWALRRAAGQQSITPLLGDIGLLRVCGTGSTYASATIGPLQITALCPGNNANLVQIVIDSSSLTVIPPPNWVTDVPSTYNIVPSPTLKFQRNYETYSTLGDLINQLQVDASKNIIPIIFSTTGDLNSPASSLTAYQGIYFPTGGVSVAPTINDYINALTTADISNYEVIAFPGIAGRDLFPSANSIFTSTVGAFPYRFICGVSGDIGPGVASASGSRLDRWQHDRLSLVSGRLRAGTLFAADADLVPQYGVILGSSRRHAGLGTHAPLAGVPVSQYIYSETDLQQLAYYGVTANAVGYNGPVIYLGLSTNTNSKSVVNACVNGVYRWLIPTLYNSVGNITSESLTNAENIVETSIQQAISDGCPIINYTYQVAIIYQELKVVMELDVSGEIQSFTTSVTIPLTKGQAGPTLIL